MAQGSQELGRTQLLSPGPHLDKGLSLGAVAPGACGKIASWELGAEVTINTALWAPCFLNLPRGAGQHTKQLQAGEFQGDS